MNQGLTVSFKPLYRIAWPLALVMLILIPVQIVIFIIAPPPVTVKGFFDLYQQNPFLGLLSLDFLYLINNTILVIIYLSLFILLFREKPVTVLMAMLLGYLGISCYYPTNPAFEMLTLSKDYFLALPEQQPVYLAAGEALLAGYTGTSFDVYYVLSTICLLLFSYAILKSSRFKRSVGLFGMTSGIFMIIPSSAGMLGMIFSLLSLAPWVVFVALLMVNFKRLASDTQLSE